MSIQKYLPSRPQERAHIVFLFPQKKMIAAEEAELKDVTLDEREKGWADEGVWRFSNTGHIFTPYPAVLRHSLPISYVYTHYLELFLFVFWSTVACICWREQFIHRRCLYLISCHSNSLAKD